MVLFVPLDRAVAWAIPNIRNIMIRSAKSLTGFELQATDGALGKVKDLYFDDVKWNVRYVVVDTAAWLRSRKVLLSTGVFFGSDWDASQLLVDLTQDQIRKSPSIDTEEPIDREDEESLHRYYGWPTYWSESTDGMESMAGLGGAIGAVPVGLTPSPRSNVAVPGPTLGRRAPDGDRRLRSVNQVVGYHIEATDGSIGHIEDFLVDDQTWDIRYCIIDTRNWLPGKKVLLAPEWISRIRWSESSAYVDLTRESVQNSPEFDPKVPMDETYAHRLHDHYERPHHPGL